MIPAKVGSQPMELWFVENVRIERINRAYLPG
jgi:hypothetical protein